MPCPSTGRRAAAMSAPDQMARRMAPLPSRSGYAGYDGGKKEENRNHDADDRGREQGGPGHEIGPARERQSQHQEPGGETQPRPAGIGDDQAEHQSERGDQEPGPKHPVLRAEREGQGQGNGGDDVASHPVRLAERPERAARVGVRRGKELGTEVLEEPEGRHRDRGEHLQQGHPADHAEPAHAGSGRQEEPSDRKQVEHGFETLAPVDRERSG